MNYFGVYFSLLLATSAFLNTVASATLPLRRTGLFWEADSPRRHYEELIASRQIRNSFEVPAKRNEDKKTSPPPEGSLKIHSKPPSHVVVAMYDRLELVCDVSGAPPPVVYWLKNGQPMREAPFDLEESTNKIDETGLMLPIHGLASTKSRLIIDCADEDTEAIYTCVAESTKERIVASTYVRVAGMAPNPGKSCSMKEDSDALAASVFMWSGTYIGAEGTDAVLLCRATGNPAPKVTWFNSDDQPIVVGSNYQILSTGDLKIHNLRWKEHMGIYKCKAENRFGGDESTTFVYPVVPDS